MAYIWRVVGGKCRPDTARSEVMNVDAVTCAFCRGWGRDRSWPHSRCRVCGGSEQVRVRPPVLGCAFCRGEGRAPWSKNTCPVCQGVGVVSVRPPIQRCDRCGGTGHNRSDRLYCIECRGHGVVGAIMSLTR